MSEASNLSDDEIRTLESKHWSDEGFEFFDFARAIEARVRASDSTARAAPTDENADWLKGYTAGQSLAHAYYDNPQIKEARSIIESAAAALGVGGTARAEPVAWRPMETAPKDGTIVRLLVAFTEHPLEDTSEPLVTIGGNTSDNTGEDEPWLFAGWSWQQDCFTQGEGTPLGWLPMVDGGAAALSGVQPPNQPTTEECNVCGQQVDPADPPACPVCGPNESPVGLVPKGKRLNEILDTAGFGETTVLQRTCLYALLLIAAADELKRRAAISQSAGTLPQTSDVHPVECSGPLSDAANEGSE